MELFSFYEYDNLYVIGERHFTVCLPTKDVFLSSFFFFVVIILLESLHRVGLYYITLKLRSSINWMAYAQCKTSTQPNSAQHKTIQDKIWLGMIHFIVVCIYVGNCDLCAEWSLQHCVRSITVHSCHLCAECILIIHCIWKKRNSIRIVFGIVRTKSGKTSEDAIKFIYFAEIFPTQFISNALIIRSVSNGFKTIVGSFELHLTFFSTLLRSSFEFVTQISFHSN